MSLSRRAAALAFALAMGVATGASAQAPEAAFATVDLVSVPTDRALLAVDFPDPMHGFAVSQYGVILATTDGGATWRQQRSGVETAPTRSVEDPSAVAPDGATILRSVSFVDASYGWAVGSPDLMLRTTDGGATWVRQSPPPITDRQSPVRADSDGPASHWDFSDVHFADRQTGHVVGVGGTILTTIDGGTTWTWRGDGRFGYLRSVSFPDPRNGRAVGHAGGEQGKFVTLATADGGNNWEMQAASGLGPQVAVAGFEDVSFTDPLRGHVVSDSGRIFATTDGGRRWSVQRKDTTETFYGVAFADARRGVAVGATEFNREQKASVVTTADGGETWVSRLVPGVILWDVTFASPTTAFAVGCEEVSPVSTQFVEGQAGCLRSMVARITFPGASPAGGSEAGSGFPLPVLVGAAVVVAGLSGVLIARRKH